MQVDEGTKDESMNDAFHEKSENDHIRVNPPTLEFTFSPTDLRLQEKTIDIVNVTSKPCSVQLIPPDTQYFFIRGLKSLQRKYLYGGSVTKVRIAFAPDDVRSYSDTLRIRSCAKRNLLIRISATPLTQSNFPTKIHFGNVPLGQTASVTVPIKSIADIKFSFAVSTSRQDPSVDIYPTRGCVYPGQKPVELFVIYRPLRYVTLNIDIRIFIPELCKTPYSIEVEAYTRPGLQRALLREKIEIIEKSTDHKGSAKPCFDKRTTQVRRVARTEKTGEISGEKDGLWRKLENIPLHTLHAVNCILNARDDKIHSQHDLLGPFNIYVLQMAKEKSIRRRRFLMDADEYRLENNFAMVHHKEKVGVGTGSVDNQMFNAILTERQHSSMAYRESAITTPDVELFKRRHPVKIRQRILRKALRNPSTVSPRCSKEESCSVLNNAFRFVEAARIILIRNRLVNALEVLKRLTPEIIERLERLIAKERQYAKRQEVEERRRKAKKL